jgi:enamine deaminase RidA (YjgF/YER057c/UK114 family)
MSIERLLPVELGQGKIRYAQGIKAGRWVFVTGCMAQNFTDGIAPHVIAETMPHGGLPKREKEAGLIFDHIAHVLNDAGTDLSNLVRTDQYYTTVEAVPPYQAVRRRTLGQLIPPSTSIAMQGFALPDADMNLQAIAIVPEDGFQVDHLHHQTIQSRPTSGYSPALTVDPVAAHIGLFSGAHGRRFRVPAGQHLHGHGGRAQHQWHSRCGPYARGHAVGWPAD